MREIEFRGQRADNKELVYGDLLNLHNGDKYIVNNKFGACIDDKGNFINTESPFVCKVIPETVGQYVGVKDKNGKKVYEGDVVKYFDGYDDKIGVVKFGEGTFDCGCYRYIGFYYEEEDGKIDHNSIYDMEDFEVIGTVFDKESDNGD